MTVQVTVTRPQGSSAGPFDIYTDSDGYETPIASNVPYLELQVGYILSDVPENATIIRVQSISGCTNEEEAYITSIPICESTPVLEKQMWMGCNLDVSSYSDGTEIPRIDDRDAFRDETFGAWCYYDNDPDNGEVYGKLYNWYAVAGIWNEESRTNVSLRKQLAPDGWKIPTKLDFDTLVNYSGGTSIAGNRLKELGDYHWPVGNSAINLNGFTALPGGYRQGSFDSGIGTKGEFWASTINYSTNAYSLSMGTGNNVTVDSEIFYSGLSVRCISNTTQVYPKCGDVEIGAQTWSRCNLNTDKYRNGDTILQATTAGEWATYAANNIGAWCYPNFSVSLGDPFKKLYNWHAISNTDKGGIVPLGYHIPTTAEFNALATEVGGISGPTTCGPKLREQGTRYWPDEITSSIDLAANNLSKFTAFPNGSISPSGTYTPGEAVWWTIDTGTILPNRKTCKLQRRTASQALSFDLSANVDSGAGVRLIKDSI